MEREPSSAGFYRWGSCIHSDRAQNKEEHGEEGQRKLWEYLNSRMDEGSHIGVSKSKEVCLVAL